MPELNKNIPATVPEQPESKPPLRKSMPVVIALVVIIALIGIANISSLLHGNKRNAPASALPMRPTAPNAQQVSSFESQQQLQAQHDAQERQRQQEIAAALAQLQQGQDTPGPESAGAPQMTPAQRSAIYGDSPNAPHNTSGLSEAQAEATSSMGLGQLNITHSGGGPLTMNLGQGDKFGLIFLTDKASTAADLRLDGVIVTNYVSLNTGQFDDFVSVKNSNVA